MKTPTALIFALLTPLWVSAALDPVRLETAVSRVIVFETPAPVPVDYCLLDLPAHLIYRVLPDYPRELRERGIMGSVEVEAIVDTIGRVHTAKAVRADYPAFADAAVKAVLDWHFEPALMEGRPVAVRVTVPFRFVIPSLLAQK